MCWEKFERFDDSGPQLSVCMISGKEVSFFFCTIALLEKFRWWML